MSTITPAERARRRSLAVLARLDAVLADVPDPAGPRPPRKKKEEA